MTKAEFVEDVEGLGKLYRIYAPFPEQIRNFKEAGITPISIRDASYTRLRGKNKENKDYTRTCHAPICAKDSPVIVARVSPLVENLEMAEQAATAHIDFQYPVFDDDKSIYAQWERIAEEDKDKKPEKRRAIILPERENYRIHRYSDEAGFFWEDTRKPYFDEFVQGDTVPCWQIPIEEVDKQDGTIINYIGFGMPVSKSCLFFKHRLLNYSGGSLGVKKSAEGSSKKFLK